MKLLTPMLSLALLAAIAVDQGYRHQVPAGAETYHALVREAAMTIPYQLGNWVGIDSEISRGALQILDANVALNRSYRQVGTNRSGTLLVVQCADARSLLGHYPPVCYPSQGWSQISTKPHEIEIEGISLHATEYVFAYDTLAQFTRLAVLHFTVLPDGRTAPDMELLERVARERKTKFLGGASIQFVSDAGLSEQDRDEIYDFLLLAAKAWIEEVQSGTQRAS
ncbi:MAG: exosortase-associated EpsI family protein [Candidatus Hydrogenedentales bacterium]|jgi:hypothetical protein